MLNNSIDMRTITMFYENYKSDIRTINLVSANPRHQISMVSRNLIRDTTILSINFIVPPFNNPQKYKAYLSSDCRTLCVMTNVHLHEALVIAVFYVSLYPLRVVAEFIS